MEWARNERAMAAARAAMARYCLAQGLALLERQAFAAATDEHPQEPS